MKRVNFFKTIILCGLLALPIASHAEDEDKHVQVGKLSCIKSGDETNIFIYSEFPVTCSYVDGEGNSENYTGTTGIALGLILEEVKDAKLEYTVLAVGKLKAGNKSLAGRYLGAKADVAVGYGLGLNVLVGGSYDNASIALITIQKSKAIGFSVGFGFLTLE